MEKGQLRCDCNVSVRPEDQTELGAKIETQEFELDQRCPARSRLRDSASDAASWSVVNSWSRRRAAGMMPRVKRFLMRTKEFAHDYRYFPDPDLVPVKTDVLVAEVRERVPELPKAKRARFVEQYQVSPYDAAVLANDLESSEIF